MHLSRKILIISTCIFFSTLVFFYVAFPPIFKFMVKYQTSLRSGNMMRKFYLKIPMALDFRINFFNVTNPDQVQEGAKPILQEVGPYCYDAYKEKIDVQDNDTEDSLTYTPYETYFFNQTRSGKLSQDDHVTIINPLIVGIVNSVANSHPALLNTVNKAIKSIFRDPTSIYVTVKVRDILFDGVVVNCTVKDFAGKAVCSQIKAQMADVVEIEEKIYLFSLFGPRNGTLPKRVKVSRGTKHSKDLGRLLELNGETEVKIWSTDECNQYHGTDGWIFPPFMTKDEKVWSFSPDLCRSAYLKFDEELQIYGLTAYKFYATLGDQSSNVEDQCYCPSPETCLPEGIFDLTKCLLVPIYATLPHFLHTDPSYLTKVDGLHPDKEKHSLMAIFEPTLGAPLEGRKRMQLNLAIGPVTKISFMQTLPEAMHPVLWIEEGVVLEGELLKTVTSVFFLLKIADICKYVTLFGSFVGLGIGGYMYFKNRNMATITPITKVLKAVGVKNGDMVLQSSNKESEDVGHVNHAMSDNDLKQY